MDPKSPNLLTKPPRKKVYIVYYLSRASHIDQPHLIEAHLPFSQDAIRLKDFKRWLSNLRGKALPNSFAWAYKRIYRNSYIWHDLSDNDIIQPLCKNEYVLIGSEIQEKCRCGFVKESSYSCKQLKDQEEEEEEEEEGGAGLLIGTTYNQQEKGSQDEMKRLMGTRDECGVYRARTPPLTNEQGTDAATQTGESKRCSTEEMYRPSLMLPNIQSSCKLSTLPSSPSMASLPPINLRAALESPDSVASSNAHKMKPKAKHPSSQVFKQLLSCGSVDIDESSIFNLKSLNMTPITPQSQRSYKAIWSSSPSMKDGNSISGLSDQSMLLRKALVSKYIDSPKRTEENIAAKDMKEESHGCHRRSLQFDYGKRMPDTTMANSPRISTSDNFTPSWRERLWSPKKDIKHGGKHEKRHQ